MEPTTHSPPAEGTIQVLLVEDDERLARLTSRYLQEHGRASVLFDTVRQPIRAAVEAMPSHSDFLRQYCPADAAVWAAGAPAATAGA